MSNAMEFFLFTPDPDFAARAVAAGVHGIVIDWERVGKEERQEAADTEINLDTVDDLIRVRAATNARILCRINPIEKGTAGEIDAAASAGADEILVPMVRTQEDVEAALELARGRVGVGILVETVEALERAEALGVLPLSRIYVGLNDLRIERGSPSIFSAVLDGTVQRIRAASRVPFGFAGLTLPEAGDPVPCRLLVAELSRLRCSFTFLRRSFRRDIAGRQLRVEIPRMQAAVRAAFARPESEVVHDRAELELFIAEHETEGTRSGVHAHA